MDYSVSFLVQLIYLGDISNHTCTWVLVCFPNQTISAFQLGLFRPRIFSAITDIVMTIILLFVFHLCHLFFVPFLIFFCLLLSIFNDLILSLLVYQLSLFVLLVVALEFKVYISNVSVYLQEIIYYFPHKLRFTRIFLFLFSRYLYYQVIYLMSTYIINSIIYY